MARPKPNGEPTTKGSSISLRLGPRLKTDTKVAAKREGRTMGEFIRRVLECHLLTGKASPDPPANPSRD